MLKWVQEQSGTVHISREMTQVVGGGPSLVVVRVTKPPIKKRMKVKTLWILAPVSFILYWSLGYESWIKIK